VKLILISCLFVSCSSYIFKGKPREGKTAYAYIDEGGAFGLIREAKTVDKKIVSRIQILDRKGAGNRLLEKSVMASQIGSIRSNRVRLLTVRPLASEYTVWLEGKKYISRTKLNQVKKSLTLTLESPETRWNGTEDIPFPKGKYFCFYNQIPECLYHNSLLTISRENEAQEFNFYVVWDSFPYVQEMYTNVAKNLFTPATLKFDGEINGVFRYIVELEGQSIFYQFSKSFDLIKIAWVTQGITVAPPGQEIIEDE
jgi:hypothetical protein